MPKRYAEIAGYIKPDTRTAEDILEYLKRQGIEVKENEVI